MRGLITDRDIAEAEVEFPGIEQLLRELEPKPRTFLDLLAVYLHDDHVSPAPHGRVNDR
ncbi:MAG TPA: hypothetical protein VFQ53_40670 [Kofleriaceae bacterium]|nr:hypothetical protein [Kofleriaceae bacterium]